MLLPPPKSSGFPQLYMFMNIDSATHMINTAIEYLLVVIFIGAIMEFVVLRNNYAQAYNEKVVLQEAVDNQLKYGGYNTGTDTSNKDECILGNHVIEVIRQYTNGEIRVYVDKDALGSEIYMDADTLKQTPYTYSVSALVDRIEATDYYHPFLVYDTKDMTDFTVGDEVTGITFVKYTGT